MTFIVQPIGIKFEEWTAQIRIDLPDVSFPYPTKVKNWRGWACWVANNNSLLNIPLPTITTYPKEEDWIKWAAYFINSMYNQLTTI